MLIPFSNKFIEYARTPITTRREHIELVCISVECLKQHKEKEGERETKSAYAHSGYVVEICLSAYALYIRF